MWPAANGRSAKNWSKETLLLTDIENATGRTKIISEIEQTLKIWKASHNGLQFGNPSLDLPVENDVAILNLFEKIEPHHAEMVRAVENILRTSAAGSDAEIPEKDISVLLDNERIFLQLMDEIVNEYDHRSKKKLQNLKQKEYLLLAFSLLILVLEVLFIFRPLSLQIRKTIANFNAKPTKI